MNLEKLALFMSLYWKLHFGDHLVIHDKHWSHIKMCMIQVQPQIQTNLRNWSNKPTKVHPRNWITISKQNGNKVNDFINFTFAIIFHPTFTKLAL